MANYLIAVGGTGQHVALAVADFIALAHEIYATPDEFPSVHLILVDADQAADTEQPSAWQEARNRHRWIERSVALSLSASFA